MEVTASPAVYGLEYSARALAAAGSGGDSEDVHHFYVGTYSLKNENHLLLLHFNDDTEQLTPEVFAYKKGEILSLHSCPTKPALLGAIRSSSNGTDAAVHLVDRPPHGSPIEDLCSLQGQKSRDPALRWGGGGGGDSGPATTFKPSPRHSLAWHPSAENSVATVSSSHLTIFDLAEGTDPAKVVSEWSLPISESNQSAVHAARWSPHQNGSTLAVAAGRNVIALDAKAGTEAFKIVQAHYGAVRTLDFNPLKAYYMVTGGDDGTLRFWDIRNPSRALASLSPHTHWVWSVRYNGFHDNLLLSSGSDSRVLLSNVASLSSEAPAGEGKEEGQPEQRHADEADLSESQQRARRLLKQDCLLASYVEHEDSVYAAEWAAGDPWIFASLSYDGRFVINRVPRDVKYSILLVQS